MNREHIAQIAHEVNRAYCAALGDDTQQPWSLAPDWQKDSAMLGVDLHLTNPEAGPEASHESWMAQKIADGWVYGEAKDETAKTHPCLVPFAELPVEQQAKDFIFRAVVHTIGAFPKGAYVSESEVNERVAIAVAAAKSAGALAGAAISSINAISTAPGMLPVKYIGKRPKYRDGAYATGIEFVQGQTQLVPEATALLMFRHADVYVRGDAAEAQPAGNQAPAKAANSDTDTEESLQEARDSVSVMDKAALITYAHTHFAGHKIPGNLGVDKIRAKVTGLIDQYGIN